MYLHVCRPARRRRSQVTAARSPSPAARQRENVFVNVFARARVALMAATAAALAGGGVVAAVSAHAAAVGCRVDYKVTSQWTGGFGGDVTVTNLGDAVNGWTLTWAFTAGQSVTQAWNASVTQSGSTVTATNVSYNGGIATNGSV